MYFENFVDLGEVAFTCIVTVENKDENNVISKSGLVGVQERVYKQRT